MARHPTWDAIPAAYRSEWYIVPGFVAFDRRGNPVSSGAGLSADRDIIGICKAGDLFRVGEIVPYRLLDNAVVQGMVSLLVTPKPEGHGLIPYEPNEAELLGLYEKFPAMRPVATKAEAPQQDETAQLSKPPSKTSKARSKS